MVAQCRVRHHVRRRGVVLRSDGNAAGPSGGVLQRSWHQRLRRRTDAVGLAWYRILEPADLGRNFRSDRRPCHRVDRLGVAGGIDDGVSLHPKRGWPVHSRRRVRTRAFPESFRHMCSRSANCFRRPKRHGEFPHCFCSAAPEWRSAAGSPDCCTITLPIMRRRSRRASAPTFSIYSWSESWSGGSACASRPRWADQPDGAQYTKCHESGAERGPRCRSRERGGCRPGDR